MKKESAPARQASVTKERIRDVAKVRFSQQSYDAVGVREIAQEAGVDAALIIRYFGSKEGLFREIAAEAFQTVDLLQGGIAALPERVVAHLMTEVDDAEWRAGYDPFRLLLCSLSSATAGPILSQCFDQGFVGPLAAELGGAEAEGRAALVASYILGFALVRVALSSPAVRGDQRDTIQRLLGEAIHACVEGYQGQGA